MKRLLLTFSALFLFCLAEAGAYTTLKTVVIDAGHGGHDPGGVSQDKRTYEKDLVLDIAKMLSYKISKAYPEVKVILSRSTDNFITLNDRAVCANKAGANLFISIHINASRNRAANGFSVHVLGQSSNKDRDLFAYNMDVCKMENSVILLENDYTTKYQGFDPEDPESFIFMQLMQNSNLEQSLLFSEYVEKNLEKGPIGANRGIWQNPFYVLWKTSMPAVLVELGFISNASDLAIMKQASNREKFANCLFKAFAEYKAAYDSSLETDVVAPAPVPASDTIPEHNPEPAKIDTVVKTQAQPAVAENAAAAVATPAPAPGPSIAEKPVATTVEAPAPSPETVKDQYGIQIFCSSKLLKRGAPEFKGLKDVLVVKVGTLYKYTVNCSECKEKTQANLNEIKKIFPSAFIVKLKAENDYFSLSK